MRCAYGFPPLSVTVASRRGRPVATAMTRPRMRAEASVSAPLRTTRTTPQRTRPRPCFSSLLLHQLQIQRCGLFINQAKALRSRLNVLTERGIPLVAKFEGRDRDAEVVARRQTLNLIPAFLIGASGSREAARQHTFSKPLGQNHDDIIVDSFTARVRDYSREPR